MDFTVLHEHEKYARISPSGQYVASLDTKGVAIIRTCSDLSIALRKTLNFKADKIKWAPDSSLFCC